ncbi:hypothetical protein [Cryobacterium sp.]|jgi:hypothetical protein|uniref:hypothetical protein n=1 Tax=Cryobacterium sp. TaxID=1926290 RepID=UPI00262545AC|nr:hypothetical protein [Cryobacterium sp.]MCU1447399.1 hypothetical protein [Cryobacterium sp.]
MTTRWARFARGWIVAGFSTFVAALSHTLGGGAVPGPLAVVVSLAFAGIVSIALSGRTLSTCRLATAVLVSQLIFHGLFSIGGAGGRLAGTDALAGHAHDAGPAVVLMPAGAAPMAGDHGAMMTAAHVLAAIVTILALRYGECAFWGLFSTARIAAHALLRLPAVVPIPHRRSGGADFVTRAPHRPRLAPLSPMRHRGPPVCLVA